MKQFADLSSPLLALVSLTTALLPSFQHPLSLFPMKVLFPIEIRSFPLVYHHFAMFVEVPSSPDVSIPQSCSSRSVLGSTAAS